MRRAIRGCPRSHVVLAALVIALVVGGCTRGAALKADAAMSTTIAMSPSPGIPSPATAKPVTLVVKGQRRLFHQFLNALHSVLPISTGNSVRLSL